MILYKPRGGYPGDLQHDKAVGMEASAWWVHTMCIESLATIHEFSRQPEKRGASGNGIRPYTSLIAKYSMFQSQVREIFNLYRD